TQDGRGGADVASDAVKELHEVVGAAVKDRLAAFETRVEVTQRLGSRAIEGRRRCLRAKRVQAEIPGVLAELYVLARLLQVAVYLRRTTYPAKCINQLDGRATHRLVHAALERGLVVEEG